ncbi:MFS transporter, partial [Bacillus vallismortis]|nr:MFS transporter [Bacillus vallismortis]
MKRFTKQENSWMLYECANSAYSIVVTTAVFPLFYKVAVAQSGVGAAQSTAYLGYTIEISTFILAMISPILGKIADNEGCKKKFYGFFVS